MATAGERLAAAEVLAKAKAKVARVRVVLDGELLDMHGELTKRLGALEKSSPEALDVAAELLGLEEQLAAAEVEFVFKGLGRKRWRTMIADFPGDDDGEATIDLQEFQFAAMAACIVEPRMTLEDLRDLEEDLDEIQYTQIWGACLKANLGSGATRPESRAARSIVESAAGRSEQPSGSEPVAASSPAAS